MLTLKVELEWLSMNFSGKQYVFLFYYWRCEFENIYSDPNPQNSGNMHINNYLLSVLKDCLDPENSGI